MTACGLEINMAQQSSLLYTFPNYYETVNIVVSGVEISILASLSSSHVYMPAADLL